MIDYKKKYLKYKSKYLQAKANMIGGIIGGGPKRNTNGTWDFDGGDDYGALEADLFDSLNRFLRDISAPPGLILGRYENILPFDRSTMQVVPHSPMQPQPLVAIAEFLITIREFDRLIDMIAYIFIIFYLRLHTACSFHPNMHIPHLMNIYVYYYVLDYLFTLLNQNARFMTNSQAYNHIRDLRQHLHNLLPHFDIIYPPGNDVPTQTFQDNLLRSFSNNNISAPRQVSILQGLTDYLRYKKKAPGSEITNIRIKTAKNRRAKRDYSVDSYLNATALPPPDRLSARAEQRAAAHAPGTFVLPAPKPKPKPPASKPPASKPPASKPSQPPPTDGSSQFRDSKPSGPQTYTFGTRQGPSTAGFKPPAIGTAPGPAFGHGNATVTAPTSRFQPTSRFHVEELFIQQREQERKEKKRADREKEKAKKAAKIKDYSLG